jgi:hypothetical protein
MAGPVSNYADEIQAAIHAAMGSQPSMVGRQFEPPVGATPGETQLLKDPSNQIPMDVAQMILGMQGARRPTQ